MTNRFAPKRRREFNKRAVAIVSCIFGVGLIVFAFGAGNNSQAERSAPEINTGGRSAKKAALQWNVALGNLVVLSPELGFNVNAAKEAGAKEEKITSAIETQLIGIRQLYREESENNPSLMGHIRLQFTLTPSGDVTQVKELSSRISDSEFKKAVLAAVSNWHIPEISAESVMINCPLLFVREGMDVTSVTMWEKALGNFEKPAPAVRKEASVIQDSKTAQSASPVKASVKTAASSSERSAQIPAEKANPPAYRVKYPTYVRKEPNFSATMLGKLTTGTKVTVISETGKWLEVRSHEGGTTGFVLAEFVTPLDLARK